MNRKLIIAFDSFKGCMSAEEACHAAAEGIRNLWPEADIAEIPLSDGGEGLVSCISKLKTLTMVRVMAHNPLMQPIYASYAIDRETAYMEMAATSGLTLVPEGKRDVMAATTYGVGEMILDAVRNHHCQKIIMGIGGSATCDGGQGMICCLEKHGLLNNGKPIGELAQVRILVACDVNNPLYGTNGAAYVFAPQKGATDSQVRILDSRLRDFARQTEQRLDIDALLTDFPGAGAAGGLGYGLMAYLKAELRPGIDLLLEIAGFHHLVQEADLIMTGEGQSDRQTLMGKVPLGVLRHSEGKPVMLLSGAIKDRTELETAGFSLVLSINEGDTRPLHELMQRDTAMDNMRKAVEKCLSE